MANFFQIFQKPERHPSPKEVEEVGRSTWTLLHSIAKYYPETPSPAEEKAILSFFESLAILYPCRKCAWILGAAAQQKLLNTSSPQALSRSVCSLHNFVNRELGKKEVDCLKVFPSIPEKGQSGWLGVFGSLFR
ncbi:mitochondrial FAD-linked sulfhydryl oxidase [Nematocida displodere]|uniref:Sulfhydryl oxidase n=1 Tax=Nematocida displodere TaxID=1805483 RepID=A0A177EK73_9MICR|nr:mitochondrial FAD-linked sulfhydryl oxidase [Nematocida displodere]